MRMGYGALLHLDSATNSLVEEFTTSGFLGHKMSEDGRHVLVVPDTDSAINSTTANSIIKIAEREGWVIERTKVSDMNISHHNNRAR
jgi:branched-chain amino acid aminotransferase